MQMFLCCVCHLSIVCLAMAGEEKENTKAKDKEFIHLNIKGKNLKNKVKVVFTATQQAVSL